MKIIENGLFIILLLLISIAAVTALWAFCELVFVLIKATGIHDKMFGLS